MNSCSVVGFGNEVSGPALNLWHLKIPFEHDFSFVSFYFLCVWQKWLFTSCFRSIATVSMSLNSAAVAMFVVWLYEVLHVGRCQTSSHYRQIHLHKFIASGNVTYIRLFIYYIILCCSPAPNSVWGWRWWHTVHSLTFRSRIYEYHAERGRQCRYPVLRSLTHTPNRNTANGQIQIFRWFRWMFVFICLVRWIGIDISLSMSVSWVCMRKS